MKPLSICITETFQAQEQINENQLLDLAKLALKGDVSAIMKAIAVAGGTYAAKKLLDHLRTQGGASSAIVGALESYVIANTILGGINKFFS